jgi:hypothetical protein
MSQLDRIFRERIVRPQDAGARRARAALPVEFVPPAGGALKYCGHVKRLDGAAQYPLALHNPFQVERLIDRNLRLLETCLALRTQAQDYQKLGDDATAAYELFLALNKVDDSQDAYSEDEGSSASLLMAQKETEQTQQTTKGTDTSVQWAAARENKLREFSQERRKSIAKQQERLEQRRKDVNDGSNYAARQKRVEDRYVELFQDAIYRSWAISDGLKIVYGKEAEPPQPSDEFLNELVHWHKIAVDEMEQTLRRDTEYALVLNLRNTQKDGTNRPLTGAAPLAGANPLASGWLPDRTFLNADTVRFRLDKASFFPDQEFIRLRGVGITIGPDKLGAWKVKITPPVMTVSEGASASLLGIPAFYVGNVRDRTVADPITAGQNYFNLDPCSGEWEIRILGNSTQGDGFSKISDMELTIVVATLPKG